MFPSHGTLGAPGTMDHFDEVRQVKMGATKLSVSHEVLLPLGMKGVEVGNGDRAV